jgi:hypothetical protein
MAQLNSRGTLTRGRWDFFEHSNGWASVYGSVPSGFIGAYFANNQTGTMQLDLYRLYWFASQALNWSIGLFSPPLILTPLAPNEIEIRADQPDRATPPGVCGMYTASTGASYTIQRHSELASSGELAPVAGEPFITLPPGWAIAVNALAGSSPCELSINVWFQETLDNISPAT